MKLTLKVITLALCLSGMVLGSCQDPTLKEVEDIACTSCAPEEPPPPGNED